MAIPELFFKNADGIIEWHKTHYPESYEGYLTIKKRIKDSSFSGSAQLLKKLESDKSVTGFLSYLTEANLASLFLQKTVANLAYEPKPMPGVDFSFDGIALSVKNLHPKNYEKAEQTKIEAMQAKGGGTEDFTHKNFSEIHLKVERTEMGTYGWERTETGHSGFLDSDVNEMSTPLSYLGEFEDLELATHKKVMFFFIQSDEFVDYYIRDVAIWYFGYPVPNYHPIFQNDMNWYLKLFKRSSKKNNIDGIVFMYAPQTLLSWPPSCLGDVINKKNRVQVYTREKALFDQLKLILS